MTAERSGTQQDRLVAAVAVTGGLLALSVALLVVTSVVGRWLFNSPINGDFEMVRIATAVGVFAYLPYAQARRANIMVDTFTAGLGSRRNAMIDAFWDCVFAGVMAFCTTGLFVGAREAWTSGETTMQLQLVVWPAILLSALLCLLLVITAVTTALRSVRLAP